MRNEILMIIVLFAVMSAMTGIASANPPIPQPTPPGYTCKNGNINGMDFGECLKASWDNINTKIDASSANTVHTDNVCYQMRYYRPGTFFENNLYDDELTNNGGRVGPYPSDPNGFYIGDLYTGLEDTHSESLNNVPDGPVESWKGGEWVVALMHKGKSAKADCAEITGLANSFKLSVPVDVPIPEFSTIALPIVAVIGLVFFFQHKKRKEE